MKSDSTTPNPSSNSTSKKTGTLPVVFLAFFGILAFFALNQFLLGKWLEHAVGPRASQSLYVVIRVAGLIYLARALVLYAKRNRFQVLSTVLLAGFIDQVFIKGLWIVQDMKANPALWQGFDLSTGALLVNLATAYLFMVPIVLIFCFLGMESVRFKKDWKLGDPDEQES